MDYGLMFFSSVDTDRQQSKYRLLLEATRFADRHGFACVWTPERHFHEFGGLFPNPALTSAALATITENVELRAGSLISPLHDPLRIAEEWSVVDNLSNGRVAVSFGSGWNIDDFVLFPDRYESRKEVMLEQIEVVRRLWRGEPMRRTNSHGQEIEVVVFPRPVQEELPVWLTSSGSPDTFVAAGEVGANLLTHLLAQDVDALATKIQQYRDAREASGHAGRGTVALMLHTFLGSDLDEVKEVVRDPFREYIRSSIRLELKSAKSGGVVSGSRKASGGEMPAHVLEDLVDLSFDRYFDGALLGTPERCVELVREVEAAGVDEIACLVDFGVDDEAALASLEFLDGLRQRTTSDLVGAA